MANVKLPAQSDVESYFKRLNNWGRWGHDDQRGTVNLITPAKQQAAQALVKTGRTVSLAGALEEYDGHAHHGQRHQQVQRHDPRVQVGEHGDPTDNRLRGHAEREQDSQSEHR